MGLEIEIIDGHNPSSYFWFKPVILNKKGKIIPYNIIELKEEFSIEEDDVYSFLSHFLFKYFDDNLTYNKRRYDESEGYVKQFGWYLTHNFYTYETINNMVNDILSTSSLLENDYNNPRLSNIKEKLSIFYNSDATQNHVGVVIDFYTRFVKRIKLMMKKNPDTNIISVMGP